MCTSLSQQTEAAASSDTVEEGLSKVDVVRVRKFTKNFDKLCKSCPTRIQPRVDTLTEMIFGLPVEERDELMDVISKRLKDAPTTDADEPQTRMAQSPRAVYELQTAGVAVPDKEEKEKKKSSESKLRSKLDEARSKLESSKHKFEKASRLLKVTNALIAKPTTHGIENSILDALSGDIERLMGKSREELQKERLKFVEKKAKCEKKLMKSQSKFENASDALNAM